ncbi:MAG: enoyl-CoA hydratase/isomerase family protein [Hyphomicrobiales bacterium]|nr:enoyl-CoA hydratase/isomerase family protein [Hyphomicrobiales bacterium]MCP5373325.1 enoyl-CoA hydratase/isomerase family protein [Hyphomicrobiales bacterium]
MTTVTSHLEDGIRTVTLNRPECLNAINADLLTDLHRALAAGNADPETRVMILTGAGRAFCAGYDLKAFADITSSRESTSSYVHAAQEVSREIALNEKMVIGAIHGWAVGAGLEWAINCDLTIMARSTRCFMPEIALGIAVTGGATAVLPKLVGLQRAKELILFGERFDGGIAQDLGLVWKASPESEVMSQALQTAKRIAKLPRKSVAAFKRVINRSFQHDVETAMDLEGEAAVDCLLTPETQARVKKLATGKIQVREFRMAG